MSVGGGIDLRGHLRPAPTDDFFAVHGNELVEHDVADRMLELRRGLFKTAQGECAERSGRDGWE